MNEKQVELSVCVRSYNQKDFLKIAIDSVLSQKTSFDFDIIVSDDCSTDGTIKMLADYKNNYPEKIRLILGEKNIGGPLNFKRVIEAAESKYIAFLDGDDYWTDNYKLQKQYDILQSHPEYAGCFHNAYTVSEIPTQHISLFNSSFLDKIITYQPIITEHWFMPTSSEVVVRDNIIFPEWYGEVANDDYVINLGLALSGPFYYLSDIMSVYRYHSRNVSRIYDDIVLLCTNFLHIYRSYSTIYPKEALPLFDRMVEKYENKLAKHIRLKKHPWMRLFHKSFYKRDIMNFIRHNLMRH